MKQFLAETHRAICHPVHTLSDSAHSVLLRSRLCARRIERKHVRFITGLSFMAAGSTVALTSGSLPVPHAVHIIIDMTAYLVHGCGTVPFVNITVNRLKMD